MSSETTLRERHVFWHSTTSSCGVMIDYHSNSFQLIKSVKTITEIKTGTFILLNLYNLNSEREQQQVFSDVDQLLCDFSLYNTKTIVFADDNKLFYTQKLEAMGGNLVLKKISISKLLEITEKYDLINIWRVRNPSSKRFTFRDHSHISPDSSWGRWSLRKV